MRHECSTCGKKFKKTSGYKSHLSSKHINSDVHEGINHICNFCGKSFSHISGLKSHIRSHEGIKNGAGRPKKPENLLKRYKCQLCFEDFNEKSDFEQHINGVHEGVKHKCETCKKCFSKTSGYKSHMRITHEGIKKGGRPKNYLIKWKI